MSSGAAVKHEPKLHIFYLPLEGEDDALSCPHVQYEEVDAKRWDFVHTETPRKHQGKGYAAQVVGAALKHCKEQGIEVIPSCSYVDAFVKKNKL